MSATASILGTQAGPRMPAIVFAAPEPPPAEPAVVATVEERELLAKQKIDERIQALAGKTPIEQQLIVACRTLLALPKSLAMSAWQEVARASAAEVKPHTLRERCAHAALRTVATSPTSTIDMDGSHAFIVRTLLRLDNSSVKHIREVTEHLERGLAPHQVTPSATFGRCAFESAYKLAAHMGYDIPRTLPAMKVGEAAWRAYWLDSIAHDGAIAAGELPASTPRPAPPAETGAGQP